MKLGTYAHVSISVHSLGESIAFYETLGFTKLWGSELPHPWALLTDGIVNIHLYEFDFVSPALHYFSSHMKDKVLELMRFGIKAEQQRSRDGNRMQHNFSDPNEMTIMLMHHSDTDMPKPNGTSTSRLGVFGEVSINTDDLNASMNFWKKLDFLPFLSGETPYAWSVISDGVLTIGLHQTSTFTSPALTFFVSDVAERVHSLKAASIPIKHEMKNGVGETEGAIIAAPDGQLLFLLKGTA